MVERLRSIALNCARAVEVEGLLTSLEEAMAKNGVPFVKGILKDNNIEVSFKHWDISLDKFFETYGLSKNKKSFVVQVKGNLDLYENSPQVIVKGGLVPVTREGAVEEYVEAAPYDTVYMHSAISKLAYTTSGHIKDILSNFLAIGEVIDKMDYMPLSSEVHSEKAGWLHHTYNMMALKSTGLGEPKEKVGENYISLLDKDVIIAALLLYDLTPFYFYNVDNETGVIDEKDVLIINEGINNVAIADKYIVPSLKSLSSMQESDIDNAKKIENVRHCIAAMNGLVDALSPEASYCTNLRRLELETFKAAHIRKRLTQDKASYTLFGEKHKCFNI